VKFPAAAVTVSEMMAVGASPPPAPVTVMVYVPGAVLEATASVAVEEPEPGAAMVDGLKPTVTPAGWPLAVSATAALNPLPPLAAMVVLPLPPCTTDTAAGPAATVSVGAAVTVSEMAAVGASPPPAPVTVMVYVPGAVLEATASVAVEVPEPGAAMVDGLKPTVTPAGWPLAVSATADSNPPLTVVVMVEVPLLPCTTETEEGEGAIVKAGFWLIGASALISPDPLGLPQPVTRSKPVTAE